MEKIGNGLKTISMNLRSIKEKDGDAFVKLNSMIKKTTDGQVSLTTATSDGREELKSTYDVVLGLSKVWGKLNDEQKAMLGEKIAGKQQANVFFSLIQNANDAKVGLEKVKEVAENSYGSAIAEQDRYMNSLSGKLNELKENIVGIFTDLGDTGMLKGIVGSINSLISGFRGLIHVVGAFPAVMGVATGSLTAFSSKFRKGLLDNFQIFKSIDNKLRSGSLATSIKSSFNSATESMAEKSNKLKTSIESTGNSSIGANAKILALKLGMDGLKVATQLARISVIALEAIFTAGLGIAIGFVIEKVVSFADKIINAKDNLREFNEESSKTLHEGMNNITQAEDKFSKIIELQSKLAKTTDVKEKVELQKKLNTLQGEMTDILPETASGYDKNNKAISSNNDLIKEQINLKKQELSIKADETIGKNKGSINDDIKKYSKLKSQMKELELMQKQGKKYSGNVRNDTWLRGFLPLLPETINHAMQKTNQELKDGYTRISATKEAMKAKMANGWTKEQAENFSGISFKEIEDFEKSLNKVKKTSNNLGTQGKGAENFFEKIAQKAEDAQKAIDNAAKSFEKFGNNSKLLKNAMAEFEKYGKLSNNTFSSMLNSGDNRIIALLANKNKFLKEGAKLTKELDQAQSDSARSAIVNAQKQLQAEGKKTQAVAQGANERENIAQNEANSKSNTYQTDVSNNANAESAKTDNASGESSNRINTSANETNTKSGDYGIDTTNHTNAENVKSQNSANEANARTGVTDEEVNKKGTAYGTDSSNHAKGENDKVQQVSLWGRITQSIHDQMVTDLGKDYSKDASNFRSLTFWKTGALAAIKGACKGVFGWIRDQISKLTHGIVGGGDAPSGVVGDIGSPDIDASGAGGGVEAGDVTSNYNPVESSSGGIDSADGGNDVDYEPTSADGEGGSGGGSGRGRKGSGKKGSGGKGKKGGSGGGSSKEEKVDIADIEDEVDAYKNLQDSIDDVNNAIDENNSLKEQATGVEKLDYMNKEIDLYKEKKVALDDIINAKKQEAQQLENELRAKGLNAVNGDISNYTEKLNQIKQSVNAMDNSNKAKEQAIKDYKELTEKANKYIELTSSTLPQLRKEWIEVGKAIKDTNKEYLDIISDVEKEITDVIKNEIDKRKKKYEEETDKLKEELDKQKDAYDNNLDEEDYQQNLKEKQDSLININNKITSMSRDTSSDGQARLKDLLEQKKELEKDLNSFIKDRQKDQADKIFDETMDNLDKKKEDKLKEFEDKYSEGKIVELAKELIKNGQVEIEGAMITLKDAIKEYYQDQGDLFSNSALKMQEFIGQLEATKKLYGDLSNIYKTLGVQQDNILSAKGLDSIPNIQQTLKMIGGGNKNITINSPLNVGNVNESNTDELKKLLDSNNKKLINEITNAMSGY